MTSKNSQLSSANAVEALGIVTLCFGWFMYVSVSAMLAGFPERSGQLTDSSLAATVGLELVLGAVALAALRWRGLSPRALLPAPSWSETFVGAGLFVVVALACLLFMSAVPVDQYRAQPYVQMASARHLSEAMVVVGSCINGLYEETFLTGYLLNALRARGASFAIGASSLVRLVYHLYQGPVGAASALLFGVLLSAFYWRWKRLWPVVFTHIAFDVWALS